MPIEFLKHPSGAKRPIDLIYLVFNHNISHPLWFCLLFQLFTEYGRLAMEETFLKPFQVPYIIFTYWMALQQLHPNIRKLHLQIII